MRLRTLPLRRVQHAHESLHESEDARTAVTGRILDNTAAAQLLRERVQRSGSLEVDPGLSLGTAADGDVYFSPAPAVLRTAEEENVTADRMRNVDLA